MYWHDELLTEERCRLLNVNGKGPKDQLKYDKTYYAFHVAFFDKHKYTFISCSGLFF